MPGVDIPFSARGSVDSQQFSEFRQQLQKTQRQMATLLGISLKGIQSFEQGWRKVPIHIEREIMFLKTLKTERHKYARPCWEILKCPLEARNTCPTWEFKAGSLCWFINGTVCAGKPMGDWGTKIKICKKCSVFKENSKERE